MLWNNLRACVLLITLSAAAAHAMPSNYPALDGRTVDTLALEQGNFDDDDETEIIMENRWLRLVIEPEHGGTISSVYVKADQLELTKRSVQGDWGGLFRNVIDGNPSKMDWYMAPFAVKVVRDTPQLAVIELSASGKSGAYTGVTLTKRYTLADDSARLKVDYVIYNNPISVEPLPFAMRMHNAVGVAGKKGHLFWPVERGMFRQEQPGGHYIWEPNPTRGYCGYATDDGAGLALRMEYRLLNKFYYWAEHGTLPRSTLEWYMNELPIPADGSVTTSLYVLPFSGVIEPSGVTDELVGKIDASAVTDVNKPGVVRITLASSVTGDRTANLRVRRLPDGELKQIHDAQVQLKAGTVTTLELPVTVGEEGTHEVVLELRHDDRPAGELRAPVIVGRAHVPYAVVPLEERYAPLAVKMLPKDFNFTSREVVTLHVPWASRYAGGTTSFFLLTDGYQQREAVELAQRYDMEPASSFLTPNLQWATYALGGYEGRISEQDLLGQMEKELAKHEKSDAILLSGPVWKWFTPWMRGALLERVAAGTGLVWVGPEETTPEIDAVLPLKRGSENRYITGDLVATGDHFITRGIPLNMLRGIRNFDAAVTDGEMIAEARSSDGTFPLIAARQFGQGRVVVLNMMVRPTAYSGHTITPIRGEVPTYHNHEYELSLIGRALIWAAGNETDTVLRAAAEGDALKVTIDSLAARDATLTVTFRDRFSHVVSQSEQPVSLKQGGNPLQLTIPVLPSGMNAAECVLAADGATLDWHVVAIGTKHPATIKTFAASQVWYEKGVPVALNVAVEGAADGAQLRISVRDAHDRLIAQQTHPASDERTINLDVPRPTTLRLYARAELLTGNGDVIGVDRAYIDYRHIMQPDDMLVSFGFQGVSQGGTPPYLMKPFYDALVRAGSNGWFHKPGHNTQAELDATRAANLPIQLTSGPLHPGKTVINSDLRQKYEQTGDPTHLRRSPLIGEEFEQRLRAAMDRLASTTSVQWGSFDFYNGDESIFQPGDIDLSFDPVTLPIFRDWLKEQYGSLDALNAEWQTTFAAWDAVMPMTRDKVVHHPSWAPWLDHRLFGDHSLAHAYRRARQLIDEQLPGMRSGASGTANTEQGSGWNWWLMRDSFTSLQPYGGDQTYQQRAFMLDVPQAGWLGYGEMEVDRYVYKIWRWLSFGSMRGINIFSGRNNVNPDLTLPPTAKAFREALDTARHGQARALFLAKPALDPIAFHYSPRSLWTAIPFGMRRQRQTSSDGMTNLLNDANLQYDYVAYEQVENGVLDEGRHRLLFLRASTALSDAEAGAIRRFVKAGGVVVADLLPGVLTAHGSRRDAGALDDVFGIEQEGGIVLGKGTFDADGEAYGIGAGKLHLEIECAAPMTATTATTLAQWEIEGRRGPALAVNRYGDGLAIYLGVDMLAGYSSARSIRHMERGQQILGSFAHLRDALLKAARIDHAAKVTGTDGKLLPAQVFRLTGDNVAFVSVISDGISRDAMEGTLRLARPAHVFDLFNGQRVSEGMTDAIDVTIAPGSGCRVFALLEEVPAAPKVSAPPRLARGQSAAIDITIAHGANAPTEYALRVETAGPDSEPFAPLTHNLTAHDGKAQLWLDAALDEAPGVYHVKVRNVLTGATGEAEIEVSP